MIENTARDTIELDNYDDLSVARSNIYALLSVMLSAPADKALINSMNNYVIHNDAWNTLKANFNKTDLTRLDDEYHRLFIGVGTGELLPYRSHYLEGTLMGKPLSELRDYMRSIGLEAKEELKDPEDHIAGIFEIMRLSIIDLLLPLKQQKIFFEKYILTWVNDFFADLSNIKDAHSYHLIAYFGQWFIKVEKRYFDL